MKLLVVALALTLSACTYDSYDSSQRPKEGLGTVGGGVLGALVGSQFGDSSGSRVVGAVAGALVGGVIGQQIGRSLDDADQLRAQHAQFTALESGRLGEDILWENPDSGNSGSFTSLRDGRDTAGAYCREYQTTVTVAGETNQAYGTACRQPDGQWEILN